MGASLAHFVVFAYNTDRKELCGARTSCDLEFVNSDERIREKALALVNREAIRKTIEGWEDTHQVVLMISIPMVTEQPYCFVLDDTADNFSVTGRMQQNDLHAAIPLEFTVADKSKGTTTTYKFDDFKPGEPTEEALAAEAAEELAAKAANGDADTNGDSDADGDTHGCTCGQGHADTD